MDRSRAANVLLQHLETQEDFEVVDYYDGNYDHMGATISDAILQAGVKYDSVVRPRVREIREKYPTARTTSAFLKVLLEVGPKEVLRWKGERKPEIVLRLTEFFIQRGIELEKDLRAWLTVDANLPILQSLKGVKNKTADYLRILVGVSTTAVDRHVFAILDEAGIHTKDYNTARVIVNAAADARGVDRSCFDHSIWRFMSRRSVQAGRDKITCAKINHATGCCGKRS